MEAHAQKCVERYCELANKKTEQLYKVSSPCLDDPPFQEGGTWISWSIVKVCSHIALKCLYLERIGRPDNLWSVNKLASSDTKWTQACDRRSARLRSYIHHTSDYWQYCYLGNTAQQGRLGLFQDLNFAGDFEDSKSTSGEILCIFGSRTFVLISWTCKKQTSVCHRSKESDIISLDAGLRMDGIPALDLWDVVIEELSSTNSTKTPPTTQHLATDVRQEPLRETHPNPNQRDTEMLINCRMWITSQQTHILLKASLSCTFLKTTKQWSKWSSKAEVQQWDMCPEPTELRSIGCLTELPWTQGSKLNTLTPRTNLQTY